MIKRIEPQEGQESLWDYPRPPRLEKCSKRIKVLFNGIVLAGTTEAYRVLETSHPPTYYIPPQNIEMKYLKKTARATFCEFKGQASYYSISIEEKNAENAAWVYEAPSNAYEVIRGYLCFYANKVDACFVNDEQVAAQDGDFYGGWITKDIVGPFKGGAGTMSW
jgi:uncharacterized protein (DUF427 family)